MASLKNVLEDIVVSEAIAQMEAMGQRGISNLSEIAAYALNRLPPMYASTDRGWLQQLKRCQGELHQRIQSTVSQAIAGAKYDPLKQVAPLPEENIETPAHALAKLQKLLGKPNLTWQNMAQVVADTLDRTRREVRQIYEPEAATMEIKDYLQQARSYFLKTTEEKQTTDSLEQPPSRSKSYSLGTSYSFTNAIENLVMAQVEQQIKQMSSILARNVRIEDAAAYALNRLPTMYATSADGLQQQQQRASTQLADELSSKVIQALLTLGKAPTRLMGPLPFNKFDLEEEQALTELKPILQRDEISWRNIVSLVEEALELARGDADRLLQMLIQVNTVFGIQLTDQDLSLVYDDLENILTMSVLTKRAFWLIVDNPQVIAKDALKIFPAISCIKLLSSMFTFPLTYTREEMEEEGVL